MRIAFNGLAAGSSPGELGRTTLNLAHALARGCPDDEILLFLPADAPADLRLDAPNLVAVPTEASIAAPLYSLPAEQVALPDRLKGLRVDAAYTPSYLLPGLPVQAPSVVTVHDLGRSRPPKTRGLTLRVYMQQRLEETLPRAGLLVCPSKESAQALEERFPSEATGRVHVLYHGVDLALYHPEEPSRGGGGTFLLVAGVEERRGPVRRLADAFPRLRARMRPCRLVAVGSRHTPPPPTPTVDFVGSMQEAERAGLVRRAFLFVQPDAYEAYALTALEAMACGTPVACAGRGLLKEVVGDCARVFDPRDAKSIAAAMEELARDDGLRRTLSESAQRRAAQFDWTSTALRLRALLAEAVA